MGQDNNTTDKSEYQSDYLNNAKVPMQLLGLAPALNPLVDHTSAQRLMMWSSHVTQTQVLHGCEFPRVYSGFEQMVGRYEYNTTERDQDIQILQVIPKFVINSGVFPINDNPYHTIVYRGCDDNKVGYFQLEKFTMRSDGYGYMNKLTPNVQLLSRGTFIPKDVKLSTSPTHDGNKYMMGTNLRAAYMSLPQVTEDAFVISESAARKLSTDGFTKISFRIAPNQIPVDCYGNENEYKFLPDIGETVREDGILCAIRTPTENSFIYDVNPVNLRKVQHLHDSVFYAPPGARVMDIDVIINRNRKVRTPPEVFAQVEKYREAINKYHLRVWDAYQEAVKKGWEITPEFNTLVTRAIESLLIDNQHIPDFRKRANVSAMYRKEEIEFMYITVTLRYNNPIEFGKKLSGR